MEEIRTDLAVESEDRHKQIRWTRIVGVAFLAGFGVFALIREVDQRNSEHTACVNAQTSRAQINTGIDALAGLKVSFENMVNRFDEASPETPEAIAFFEATRSDLADVEEKIDVAYLDIKDC